MLGHRSLLCDLEPIDSEIERTFHQKKKGALKEKEGDQIKENIIKDKMAREPQERPFKDYFSPLPNLSTSCIRYPDVTVKSFEIKSNVLNYLPSFCGLDNEDTFNHLNDFDVVCQTFKYENFSVGDVKLHLFPF